MPRPSGPAVGGVLGLVLVVVLVVGAVVLLRDNKSKPAASAWATRPPAPEAVQFRRVIKADPGACGASSAGTVAPDGTACGSDGTRYTPGKVEQDGGLVSEVKPPSLPAPRGMSA